MGYNHVTELNWEGQGEARWFLSLGWPRPLVSRWLFHQGLPRLPSQHLATECQLVLRLLDQLLHLAAVDLRLYFCDGLCLQHTQVTTTSSLCSETFVVRRGLYSLYKWYCEIVHPLGVATSFLCLLEFIVHNLLSSLNSQCKISQTLAWPLWVVMLVRSSVP